MLNIFITRTHLVLYDKKKYQEKTHKKAFEVQYDSKVNIAKVLLIIF